jgi:hypothetical protein
LEESSASKGLLGFFIFVLFLRTGGCRLGLVREFPGGRLVKELVDRHGNEMGGEAEGTAAATAAASACFGMGDERNVEFGGAANVQQLRSRIYYETILIIGFMCVLPYQVLPHVQKLYQKQ